MCKIEGTRLRQPTLASGHTCVSIAPRVETPTSTTGDVKRAMWLRHNAIDYIPQDEKRPPRARCDEMVHSTEADDGWNSMSRVEWSL